MYIYIYVRNKSTESLLPSPIRCQCFTGGVARASLADDKLRYELPPLVTIVFNDGCHRVTASPHPQ